MKYFIENGEHEDYYIYGGEHEADIGLVAIAYDKRLAELIKKALETTDWKNNV